MIRRPPRSTPVPYTALFRSEALSMKSVSRIALGVALVLGSASMIATAPADAQKKKKGQDSAQRSEEHTSELQSRQYLVCRLLLDKEKHPVIGVNGSYHSR